MEKVNELAKNIQLVVLDVDGVLTDGGLYFTAKGEEIKRFNSLDGHGIKMLKKNGIEVAVITARDSEAVACRMKNLDITHFYQGRLDKLVVFNDLLQTFELSANEVAYVGDDVIDLPVMLKAGFSIAVDNAHELVKQHSDFVTKKSGGHGAVREVCDLILKAQAKFDNAMKPYLT